MKLPAAFATVLLLAACGGSSPRQLVSPAAPARPSARPPTAPPQPIAFTHSVTVRTAAGLRFAATLTRRRGRECLLEDATLIGAGRPPYQHVTRSCGRGNRLARPVLIEAAGPPTALILDQTSRGCGRVVVKPGAKPASPARTACSASRPILRLTVLPNGRTVSVRGIAGVTRLRLLPIDCAKVCVRPV